MQNRIKIIGAVGRNGSGKDEVLKYLKSKRNIPFLSTGDMVREIAKKEGKEPTRENLGEISERYFKQLGKGCFVKMLADNLKQSGLPIAGISGIRSLDDVKILKQIFGDSFILIRVNVTDPKLRFKRMTARNETRDPHTYAQFLSQEENEYKLFNIQEAEKLADYTINNDSSLEELYSQIDHMVEENRILST
jgi:dephospho-CoA kinase